MFNDFEMKLSQTDNWQLMYLHVYYGIFIAENENDYKKGKKIEIENPKFHFTYISPINEEFNVLEIKGTNKTVYVRARNKISLEYIIYNSQQKNERDLGRPMTFNPHLINVSSVLEKNRVGNFNFKGIINLVVVALIFSHIRLIYDSLKKYGFLLKFEGGISQKDLLIIFVSAYMNIFSIIFCFLIERLAPILSSKNIYLINILHILNLGVLLSLPFVLHFLGLSNPAIIIFALTLTVIVFLKLFSWLHFWDDVRKFMFKRKKLEEIKKKDLKENGTDGTTLVETKTDLNSLFYEEIDQIISNYPNNVKFFSKLSLDPTSGLISYQKPTLPFRLKYNPAFSSK